MAESKRVKTAEGTYEDLVVEGADTSEGVWYFDFKPVAPQDERATLDILKEKHACEFVVVEIKGFEEPGLRVWDTMVGIEIATGDVAILIDACDPHKDAKLAESTRTRTLAVEFADGARKVVREPSVLESAVHLLTDEFRWNDGGEDEIKTAILALAMCQIRGIPLPAIRC